MKRSMVKYLQAAMLCFCMMLMFNVHAQLQDVGRLKVLSASELTAPVPPTLRLQYAHTPNDIGPGENGYKTKVSLVYGREAHTDVVGNHWSLQVNYKLNFSYKTSYERTGTLELSNFDNGGQYEDYELHGWIWDPVLTVTSVSFKDENGVDLPLSEVPSDVRLIFSHESERRFSRFSTPEQGLVYDANADRATWGFIPGASEYELQWVFFDDYDEISLAEYPFDGPKTYNDQFEQLGTSAHGESETKTVEELLEDIVKHFQSTGVSVVSESSDPNLIESWNHQFESMNVQYGNGDDELRGLEQIYIDGNSLKFDDFSDNGSTLFYQFAINTIDKVLRVSDGVIQVLTTTGSTVDVQSSLNREGYKPLVVINPFTQKEPVNILTTHQHFDFDLNYPEGVVYFRVRGVTKDHVGLIRKSDWYYDHQGTVAKAVSHGLELNKNWQCVNVYAEEGKHKSVMTYADGSQRSRQVLTNLSTDGTVAIGETKYDFEGRPVVNVLPVPLNKSDFTYVNDLNVFSDVDAVIQKDFFDNMNPEKLLTSSGVSKYYSANHNSPAPASHIAATHDEYIPDAEGYPYTQMRYTRDATGRVAASSGLGGAHHLHDGNSEEIHYTRNYYGTPNATELYQMFGTNVGDASHYQKNMVVDANGQVSVSYVDHFGNTIATSLAGDAPGNVTPLTSESSAEEDFTAILSTGTYQGGDHIESINTILNSVPGTGYTFDYDLTGMHNELLEVCRTCEYELEISITGPDGKPVQSYTSLDDDDNEVIHDLPHRVSFPKDMASHVPTCDPADYDYGTETFGPVIFNEIGNYNVKKTLKLKSEAINTLREDLFATITIDEEAIRNQVISTIDLTQCDYDCDDCALQGLEEVFADQCNGLLTQMQAQIAPGGKYYDYDNLDYRAMYNNKYVTVDGIQTRINSNELRLDDFFDPSITSWQTQWESDLVEPVRYQTNGDLWAYSTMRSHNTFIHPEYHWYYQCASEAHVQRFETISAKEFELQLLQANTWAAAEALGFVSNDDILYSTVRNEDPIVSNDWVWWRDRIDHYPNGTSGNSIEQLISNPALYSSGTVELDHKWALFKALYLQLRQDFRDYKVQQLIGTNYNSPPLYLSDDDAVVREISGPSSEQEFEQMLADLATEDCELICENNVEAWINVIGQNCVGFSGISEEDSTEIAERLSAYCIGQCGLTNTLNVILTEHFDSDNNLTVADGILRGTTSCHLEDVLGEVAYADLYSQECNSEQQVVVRPELLTFLENMVDYFDQHRFHLVENPAHHSNNPQNGDVFTEWQNEAEAIQYKMFDITLDVRPEDSDKGWWGPIREIRLSGDQIEFEYRAQTYQLKDATIIKWDGDNIDKITSACLPADLGLLATMEYIDESGNPGVGEVAPFFGVASACVEETYVCAPAMINRDCGCLDDVLNWMGSQGCALYPS